MADVTKILKLITLDLYDKLAAKISDKIKNIELTPGPQGPTGATGAAGAKGETGERGPQGYTFTPKVDANGNLSWTNNGELDNPVTVNIKGPQGEKGATGDRGPQGLMGPQGPKGDDGYDGSPGRNGIDAGFGTVTAKMGNTLTGTPSVSVSTSGDSSAKNFEFTFSNLKGATGAQGPQGPAGTYTAGNGININNNIIKIDEHSHNIRDVRYLGDKLKRTATIVVGTSLSGHTEYDCDYDYLCGGTADQVWIQNAINDLPEGGGKVVLLEGTYNISGNITIGKADITIEGMGNSTIIKRSSASADTLFDIPSDGVVINRLTLDFNKDIYPISQYGFIMDVRGKSFEVHHCVLKNGGYGINIHNRDCRILYNTIENMAYTAINSTHDRNANLNTFIIGNCIGDCDRGIGGLRNSIASKNRIINCGIGIYFLMDISWYNHVHGNYIIRGNGTADDYSPDQYTILIDSGAQYNDISDNYIPGKNYVNNGGATNTFADNKYS